MYRVGQKEIDAVARLLKSARLFRYGEGGRCEAFERQWARRLGVRHATLTSSGTTALTAALAGAGIGPGDEVLIPACTYMATAVAVLAAGAIPVIVDIDESITLDPDATDAACGPRTRAVVPVHMWGLPCDMRRIMQVARRRGLVLVEDACQAVGGSYRGRPLGSFGSAAAFSFNYYKNITCGEGGAAVTDDATAAERIRCMVDCCNFYWTGRHDGLAPFVSCGSRASEIEGAMLLAQLTRLDGLLRALRREKARILRETADTGLAPVRANCPDGDCGSHVMFALPTAAQADAFAAAARGTVLAKTGRHVYTEWDPILARRGAHHPALDPFNLPENRQCRKDYRKDLCPRTLDILARTVSLATHPDHTRAQVTATVRRIRAAAKRVL